MTWEGIAQSPWHQGMREASGPGLAFIVYPEVVTLLPAPQVSVFIFVFEFVNILVFASFVGIINLMTAYHWQVWAALFFLMLITLALGRWPSMIFTFYDPHLCNDLDQKQKHWMKVFSIFGAFETVITALSDQWPALRPHKPKVVEMTIVVIKKIS